MVDAARLERTLNRGRHAAETRMLSRCTIRRPTGRTAQDEGSGEEVPVWLLLHVDLPFRLSGARGAATTRTVKLGDEEFQQAVRVGHLPAATDGLQDGDWIDVTRGENAGRALRIVEATWQDQATARRVPVVEVDRPEEW